MSESSSKRITPPKHPELVKFGKRVSEAIVRGLNQQFPPKQQNAFSSAEPRPIVPSIHIEPDDYPSVEAEPLSAIELDAIAHWERFCPKLVAALRAQGPNALETAIRAAWWKKEYLTELALTQAPGLPRLMAEEPYRELLWPAPERPEGHGP